MTAGQPRPTAVDRLVTRLPEDAGYAESQDVPQGPRKGLPVYVCPRADDHGRRDGLIPPGVAAVRGLVPRTGLRHVSNQSVGREAARDGLTEAERYRRYYGRAAAGLPGPAPAPEDFDAAGGEYGHEAPAAPAPRPSAVRAPVRPVPGARTPVKTPVKTAAKTRLNPHKKAAVPVLRDDGAARDEGTLDGFYDSLAGRDAGTPDFGGPGEPDGGDRASARGARRAPPPPPTPRVREDPCAAEVAELRRALDVANSALGGQQELIARLQAEAEMLRKQPAPEPVVHETVRVQLAAEPEKLKLGGRGWECRVLGHLDFGREGRSAVLTVTDPGYASELMAEIQVGELVILHGRGRTACEYAGECAKLYGDQDGADFIALFRFSLAGSGE